MKFLETRIQGVVVVEPTSMSDERGLFTRTFCSEEFRANGLESSFVQSSTSFNRRRGTLRGLHFQIGAHAEDKLIRCTAGAVFDVAVDLRPSSPTLYSWIGVELSSDSRIGVYVPKGCAHGFVTLTPDSELLYLMTVPYDAASARGVRYDDPSIGIKWPEVGELTLSPRDEAWPPLSTGPDGQS